jgi:hypothetical protein
MEIYKIKYKAFLKLVIISNILIRKLEKIGNEKRSKLTRNKSIEKVKKRLEK